MNRDKVEELIITTLDVSEKPLTIFSINSIYPGLQPEEISKALHRLRKAGEIEPVQVGMVTAYELKD